MKDELAAKGGAANAGRLKNVDYKWIVLSVTTIGALMSSIDTNIVNLAMPDIISQLRANLVEMVWVVTGYTLVSSVFMLAFGRVADMFGRVRLYNLGFVLFTIFSVLCGLSQTAMQLIVFRLLQGCGGAMIMVNSAALLTEVFPANERGRALGINNIAFASGGVLGPILGGLILGVASWRWIFWINLPIGLVGTYWGYRVLKEVSSRHKGERFDLLGAFSFSAGLTALLLALTEGIKWGWTSTPILSLFGLFGVMTILFIWWERRAPTPVLDFSLFKNRVYDFSVLSACIQSLAIGAATFLVSFYLQTVRGYDPLHAALMLIPMPIFMSSVAPFSGSLADRIGARLPATAGLLIQAFALFLLSRLTPDTPYQEVAIMLGILGLGAGLFMSPNTSAAMNAAPSHRLGVASAAMGTMRTVGRVVSLPMALAVAAASLPEDVKMQIFTGTSGAMGTDTMPQFVVGMHYAFLLSLALCLVAAGLSFVRGKEDRQALTDQHSGLAAR